MKIRIIVFILVFCTSEISIGQESQGGGTHMLPQTDACITDEQRAFIQSTLNKNILQLKEDGVLNEALQSSAVSLRSPVVQRDDLNYFNAFAISNFLDQSTTSEIQDYNCGSRSYDGHKGTDIATWPFSWYLYENDFIDVVAAADGIIIWKQDGNGDNHCECFGNWNAVYIMHPDGSIAWYGHLKRNSLLTKEIGASVTTGEFLGKMASSGCSTGPHLHLELYDAEENLIDPYSGTCNDLNGESWWEKQENYFVPQVNALFTHDAPPEFGCPTAAEFTHFSNVFDPGELIYFVSYFRDHVVGSVSEWTIINPLGEVWENWSHTSPMTYSTSYWYWSWFLPFNGPFGEWEIRVRYMGETYSHFFNYGVASNVEDSNKLAVEIYPNPSTGMVYLDSKGRRMNNIQVIDIYGKSQFFETNQIDEIDLSDLPRGVYFLTYDIGDHVYTERIIIDTF